MGRSIQHIADAAGQCLRQRYKYNSRTLLHLLYLCPSLCRNHFQRQLNSFDFATIAGIDDDDDLHRLPLESDHSVEQVRCSPNSLPQARQLNDLRMVHEQVYIRTEVLDVVSVECTIRIVVSNDSEL